MPGVMQAAQPRPPPARRPITPRGTTCPPTPRPHRRGLRDYYAFQVNVAIEEGREREIDGLVAKYPEEAAGLIAEAQAQAA
jgi:hypothetical protein